MSLQELEKEARNLFVPLQKEYIYHLNQYTSGYNLIKEITNECNNLGISTKDCDIRIGEIHYDYDNKPTTILQFIAKVDKTEEDLKKDIEEEKQRIERNKIYKLKQFELLKKELSL